MLTVGVLHGYDVLLLLEIMEQRCKDSPGGIKFVVTHKVGVIALECVEDE